MMRKKFPEFSGIFFLLFIVAAAVTGLFCLKQALSSVDPPIQENLVHGKWTAQIEKSFREALPINAPSRTFWGRTEYALFHQGRKGVVTGTENWLFSDEEFSCPVAGEKNLAENFTFISAVQETLKQRNILLEVVLVPAKARLFPQHLGTNQTPACRGKIYEETRAFLHKQKIPATDLLARLRASPALDTLYLKTDTHWTPAGARIAATVAAQLAHHAFPGLTLTAAKFSGQTGTQRIYEGDLLRYLPGVSLPRDSFVSMTTQAPAISDAAAALLDDTATFKPQITLVGTSYSANANWNFAGFLKESLGADVLNMAADGLGPFAVMDAYLKSDTLKTSPPRLLIWEIPERFLFMPHGINRQE